VRVGRCGFWKIAQTFKMKIDLKQARLASDLLDQISESMDEAMRERILLIQQDLRAVIDDGYRLGPIDIHDSLAESVLIHCVSDQLIRGARDGEAIRAYRPAVCAYRDVFSGQGL
jgi:hypothetical protein